MIDSVEHIVPSWRSNADPLGRRITCSKHLSLTTIGDAVQTPVRTLAVTKSLEK